LYHEVVYQRVSAGQRRRLHQRIGTRKEAAYGPRARDMAAELAVHFARGHDPRRAVHYFCSAGENTMQWCACKEAVAYFEQALEAMRHLPAHRDTQAQAIDLRFALRNALLPLAEHHRILALLREAEPLAETLDDAARLGRVYIYKDHSLVLLGADDEALEAVKRAHTLAAANGDTALQIMADARLGVLYRMRTDYQQGIAILRQALALLQGVNPHERFGGVIPPAIFARFHLGECLAEVGAFAEALAQAEEALQIAKTIEHPWAETSAHRSLGHVYLRQGDLSKAIPLLERAWQLSRALRVCLRPVGACHRGPDAARGGAPTGHTSVIYLPAICEAYLVLSRAADARDLAQQALAYSRARQRHGTQAQALWLMGNITVQHDIHRANEAQTHYQQALALAEARGMRPLQAHCHLGLGTLYATTGQQRQAHAALSAALALYRAMDMTFWVPQVEAALAQMERQ
jgi:tetratricopeptide (TPR) repeat protein